MSPATKRKCASMIEAWIYTIGYTGQGNNRSSTDNHSTLQFVTLTLSAPQVHRDQELRRILFAPFIQDLKRFCDVDHYFWKAEKAGNSRLHFHVLIGSRIAHKKLREIWNKHQANCGYIERYKSEREEWHKSGFKINRRFLNTWSAENQLKAYHRGKSEGWQNPNSTDIHSLRSVRSAHAYIVKYCLKSVDKNKVAGRIWGCSDGLRDLVFTSEPMGIVEQIELHNLVRKTKAEVFSGDHFSVTYNFTSTQLQLHAPTLFSRLYNDLKRFGAVLDGTHKPQIKAPPKISKPTSSQTSLSLPLQPVWLEQN